MSHDNLFPSKSAPRRRSAVVLPLIAVAVATSVSCRSSVIDNSLSGEIPLSISPPAETLTVGDSGRLSLLGSHSYSYFSNTASWATSDASIATVSKIGEVWARGKGSATITVTDGPQSASSNVVVTRPPLSDLTVIAHRGFAGVFPENTLIAVQKAFEAGADAVEVDVALSADSIPMIMHDPTVDRTTNGTGAVNSLSSTQLRALDACSKAGSQWQPCPVPFAREILEAAVGRGRVLLHLKGAWPNAALDRLVALVHSLAMADGVTIIAFEHYWLEYLHNAHPEITLGYLARSTDPASSFLSLGDGAGLYYDSVLVANPGFGPSIRQEAVAHGAAIGAWTIHSSQRAATLRALGAGWLISDVPLSKDSLRAISVSP